MTLAAWACPLGVTVTSQLGATWPSGATASPSNENVCACEVSFSSASVNVKVWVELPLWTSTPLVLERVTEPPASSAMTRSTSMVAWPLGAVAWTWNRTVDGVASSGTSTSRLSAGDVPVPVVVTLDTMSPPPRNVVPNPSGAPLTARSTRSTTGDVTWSGSVAVPPGSTAMDG